MLTLEEYSQYDGLGLAALVARKEVSPEELIASALAAIEKLNPQLNAVLAGAKSGINPPQGPFRGVPLLIKELLIQAENSPLRIGSRLAQKYVATHDSELMTRFRRAGFILAGTTQTPECGYSPTTEPLLFGPVQNPWKSGYSAGGSSGGSGAAVAAGIVPIAHGNDGGGSIRIPASCNGLVGLKPSRDRIPTGPDFSDPTCGMIVEFALTRTVRDAAALLDALAGADAGAPGLPIPPKRPFLDELSAKPGKLRIAWTTTTPSGEKCHPECEQAVHNTVRTLEQLGHHVEESHPQYDWEAYLESMHVIWTANTAVFINKIAAEVGNKPGPDTLEACTLACWEEGQKYSAIDLVKAMDFGGHLSRLTGRFFEKIDLFLTPTLAKPPVKHGELNQNDGQTSAKEWTRKIFSYIPFTPLANTTGQPAISLPLHWSGDGLPIGVQFMAPLGDEAMLLRLAAQLEEALPWGDKKPQLHI